MNEDRQRKILKLQEQHAKAHVQLDDAIRKLAELAGRVERLRHLTKYLYRRLNDLVGGPPELPQ